MSIALFMTTNIVLFINPEGGLATITGSKHLPIIRSSGTFGEEEDILLHQEGKSAKGSSSLWRGEHQGLLVHVHFSGELRGQGTPRSCTSPHEISRLDLQRSPHKVSLQLCLGTSRRRPTNRLRWEGILPRIKIYWVKI